MKGVWAMLTGKGGREYKQQHDEFDNAIPDRFPFRAGDVVRFGPGEMDIRDVRPEDSLLPKHPAYEGRLSRTRDAELYRRANAAHGGTTKAEHAKLTEYQRTHKPNGEYVGDDKSVTLEILEWLWGRE